MLKSKASLFALSAYVLSAALAVACGGGEEHKSQPATATSTAAVKTAASATASAAASAATATTASAAASASAAPADSAAASGAITSNMGEWKASGVTFDKDDKNSVNKKYKLWRKSVFNKCLDAQLKKDPASVSGVLKVELSINKEGEELKAKLTLEPDAKVPEDMQKCIKTEIEKEKLPKGDKAKLEFKVTFGPEEKKEEKK